MTNLANALMRLLIFASYSLFAVAIWPVSAHAQSAKALPNYVITQFGKPPSVPTGPLSIQLNAAVKTAFIENMNPPIWEADQDVALQEIAESKDPRLAWIISDLMRFASNPVLNTVLAR